MTDLDLDAIWHDYQNWETGSAACPRPDGPCIKCQARANTLARHMPTVLREVERLRDEVKQYREAVHHVLALAPDEYRQTIVAARAAGSDSDYAKNNGRAESIRVFATGLAERAGLPVIDWEQIKRDVPADGVYRATAAEVGA